MCIHFASSSNCTLIVVPEGIFIVSLAFFFLRCYVLFVRDRNTAIVFVRSEIQALFHHAIVTLQLLELTSHGFIALVAAFAMLVASPIKEPSAPNIDRIDKTPSHFAVRSIRFFVIFFLVHF